MQKKTTIASIAAALILGAAMSASAQSTAATAAATTTPGAQQANNFAETRRVLAKSNLCDWYRTGGITWDYAGQQTFADWTAATQAVTTELRATDPSISGDRLMRVAEQRIDELCANEPTRTAVAI